MNLTLTEFVMLVFITAGALVVLFTMISRSVRVHAESRSEARRVVCRLCLHAFEAPTKDKIVKCEHCGATNERGLSRRLG